MGLLPGRFVFGVNFASIVGRLGERVLWRVLPEAAHGVGVLLSAIEQGDGVILRTYRSEDPKARIPGTIGDRYFFHDCPDARCSIIPPERRFSSSPGTASRSSGPAG